ncbi:MAG: HEAT repeat domain-containing protein [Planctomycetes bacterium]|nr:HEAT repeat domain-containing protein [Planctomycetota bacterium]
MSRTRDRVSITDCFFAPLAIGLALGSASPGVALADGGNLVPTWGGRSEHARAYDLIDVRFSIDFDLDKQHIRGEVTNTISPILDGMHEAVFDSEDLKITKASIDGHDARFLTDPKHVIVPLDRAAKAGEKIAVTITYEGNPTNGLHWVGPEPGYPDKPKQCWSQGEDMDNHFWIPTWDYPNDRATTECFLTCADDLVAVSNGVLVDSKPGPRAGTKTWHYKMDQPYVTYLIDVAIGPFERFADDFHGKPVEYFVNKGVGEATARRSFGDTPDMLAFFSEKIGVEYPWPKYAQVAVTEFVVGGMENVSATLQTDSTLHDERSHLDTSSEGLVSHELAHQWWGDYLTCRDWSHLWLNEGFATYFQVLYAEHKRGTDELRLQMRRNQANTTGGGGGRGRGRGGDAGERVEQQPKPLVSTGWTRTGDDQSFNVYNKGASVLHMLRFVLGDDAFWKAMGHYCRKNALQLVDSRAFQVAINEATGQPLEWFFEEWVTGSGTPAYEVTASWDGATMTETLVVKQTQKVGGAVPLFRMPVDVKFVIDGKKTVRRIWVTKAEESFSFPLEGRPQLVRFDDGGWICKTLKFEKTTEDLLFQLTADDDLIGRLEAMDALADQTSDDRVVDALAHCLASKDHKDLRDDAARALGKRKDSAVARQALVAALADPESTVRGGAAAALGAWEKDADVYAALKHLLETDPSYRVRTSSLRAMRRIKGADAWDDLVAARAIPSFRDQISDAAIESLADIDGARALPVLLEEAAYGKPYPTRFTAMSALARQAKSASDEDKKKIFEVLEKGLDDRYFRARSAAIRAVADAGDVAAKPKLQKLVDEARDERFKGAAKAALDRLEPKK